jgi:hypothetical protein
MPLNPALEILFSPDELEEPNAPEEPDEVEEPDAPEEPNEPNASDELEEVPYRIHQMSLLFCCKFFFQT